MRAPAVRWASSATARSKAGSPWSSWDLRNDSRGLVGCEHDGHRVRSVRQGASRQRGRIGGRGIGEVEHVHVGRVGGAPARPAGLAVGAHRVGRGSAAWPSSSHARRGLREERQARHQDENATAGAGDALGDPAARTSVLPVPQAISSLPRVPGASRCARALSMASCWCGRGVFGGSRSSTAPEATYEAQSMGLALR